MSTLIKVIEQNGKKAVNARELHQFLEVETRFNDWIIRRIDEYKFIENQDFEVLLKNEENPSGGRPAKEYAISLDMAKELSMVEKNEKGRQARRYFIEMERIAKQELVKKLQSGSSFKKIKVSKDFIRDTQRELLIHIGQQLNKKDVEEFADKFNLKYYKLYRMLKGKAEYTEGKELIQDLYERALENKFNTTQILKGELTAYQLMIEELKK